MWKSELTGTIFPIYCTDVLVPLTVGVLGSCRAGLPLNPALFKYLETTMTNQNCTHGTNLEHSKFGECLLPCVSEFLPSCLLSKNVKIKIYKPWSLFPILQHHSVLLM
jgi:hypothetical protein